MVDHTSKITLKGEDKTGPAFKSWQKNISDTAKELEKLLGYGERESKNWQRRAKDTRMYYDDFLKMQLKARQAQEAADAAAVKGGNAVTDAHEKQRGAAKAVADEIRNMVGRYASMGAAADAARRAYLGFAEGERKMLVLQNTTKATTAAIGASEKALREASRVTGTSFDEALNSANKLRTGLNITLDDAIKKFPRLAVVAKGMGVSAGDLGKITTDFMRNMNIPATQFNESMELVAGIVRETNIDIKDLIGTSGELGEVAKEAGYKGQEGLARMGVQLGIAADIMGDTSRGARLLMRTFGEASQLGDAFGIPAKQWKEQLENVKKADGDVQAFIVNKIKGLSVRDKELFYQNVDIKQRLLLKKLEEENDGRIAKKIRLIRDLGNGQQAVIDGMRVMNATSGGVDSLTASIGLLADEFGRLMVTMDVPQVIAMFTKELQRLGAVAQWFNQLLKWIKGEGEAPSIIGPHRIHAAWRSQHDWFCVHGDARWDDRLAGGRGRQKRTR